MATLAVSPRVNCLIATRSVVMKDKKVATMINSATAITRPVRDRPPATDP